LGRVARSQMSGRTNEAIFDKLDDRGVVHWDVRNIVPPRERGDDEIRDAEAELSGKSLLGSSIARIRAGVGSDQVAVSRRGSA